MALVQDTTTSQDVSTDASFRAFVAAVRAALTGAGLVRTTDTGQIDPTTVAGPAASAYAGYDVYRFDDADQGAHPVFFKLEYGRGSATTRSALRLTVGTGSDGSGGITNPSPTLAAVYPSNGSGVGEIAAAHASDGSLALLLHPITGNTSKQLLVIERERNTDESVSSRIVAFASVSSTPSSIGCKRWDGGSWAAATLTAAAPSVAASGEIVFTLYRASDRPSAPFRALALSRAGDIGASDAGSISIGGAARAFKRTATSSNMVIQNFTDGSTANGNCDLSLRTD